MSTEINSFIATARDYQAANAAYSASDAGKAEITRGANGQALRQELVQNGIEDERVLSRPPYWQKKFC